MAKGAAELTPEAACLSPAVTAAPQPVPAREASPLPASLRRHPWAPVLPDTRHARAHSQLNLGLSNCCFPTSTGWDQFSIFWGHTVISKWHLEGKSSWRQGMRDLQTRVLAPAQWTVGPWTRPTVHSVPAEPDCFDNLPPRSQHLIPPELSHWNGSEWDLWDKEEGWWAGWSCLQSRGQAQSLDWPAPLAQQRWTGNLPQESYPVLCLVSLRHRSGREVFKDSHDWSLT